MLLQGAKWSKSCVLIGYPNRKVRPILTHVPAKMFSFGHVINHLLTPGYPIDGNRWSQNQSINRYQSIKLVNWYRLVLVNRWSIDNHKKIAHQLASIGTGPRDRRHARYLSDHPPFLGSPGDKIGKTIPTQTSQRKEYTLLHAYSNYPLARHCLSVS